MKFAWTAILAASALIASPVNLEGTWKLRFTGPVRSQPKTVGSIVLDLKVAGDKVTGTAHIGSWPGDAPIENGKFEGDHITFTATGHLNSSTGIPTCEFAGTLNGEDMVLTMAAIHNAGGPLGQGITYEYAGKKE